MIKINLLPEAKVELARRPAVIPAAVPAENVNNYIIIGFFIIGVLLSGYLWFSKYNAKKKLEGRVFAAKQEAEALKTYIEQVNRYENNKQQLEKKLKLIQELRANQAGPVHIMDEIASLVPDLLWLTDLTLKGKTIEIKGNVFNPNAVAEFLQRLDESPYFDEPTLKEMKEQRGYHSFSLTVGYTFSPGEEKKPS